MFNTYARLRDGLPMYKLGVPAVPRRPAAEQADDRLDHRRRGAGGDARLRLHLGQHVRRGERAIAAGDRLPAMPTRSGTSATSTIPPAPTFTGFADCQKKRLYRTITGASGQTTYYRVAEIAAGDDDLRRRRRR